MYLDVSDGLCEDHLGERFDIEAVKEGGVEGVEVGLHRDPADHEVARQPRVEFVIRHNSTQLLNLIHITPLLTWTLTIVLLHSFLTLPDLNFGVETFNANLNTEVKLSFANTCEKTTKKQLYQVKY